MKWRALVGLFLAFAPFAAAQDELVEIELTVERAGPGQVATVDGGSARGLAAGDRVAFHASTGDEREGEVVRVDETSALVSFAERGPLPEPGTKASASIPKSRLAPAAPKAAQERTLDLRVVESGPGARARVDRGRADGLREGDRVRLDPRDGAPREGRVTLVDERSAEVELEGAGDAPPPGTRGEVRIAADRVPGAATSGAPAPTPVAETPPVKEPEPEVAPKPPAPAQDRTLELRATSVGPGAVAVVDRGASDGLRAGDRVRLTAANGEPTEGVVVQLGNKSAVLELDRNRPMPEVGARGEARIPAERLAREEVPKPVEHEPWETDDTGFTSDMPLLTQVKAVRPDERPAQLSGFGYASLQTRFTDEAGRSDSFYRTGGGFRLENPFGNGGTVQFDAELNYRTTSVPDVTDSESLHFRLDRLSYAHGGDRFSPARWEFGRFLQNGMPEFGILDGAEWGYRRSNGDRYGVSAGFIPELSGDLQTGRDFQLGAWYELVSGDREEFTLAGGYQKTLHDGDADRDLFVARMNYVPEDAWDLRATAWVDLYGSGDTAKSSGPALTEAWVQTERVWSSGNGLSFTYRHLETPEVKSDLHVPITPTTLSDGRYDRLSGNGWRWLGKDQRLHAEVGGWIDEQDEGGDAQLGIELREVLFRRSRADLTAFGSLGRFGEAVGGRASFGRSVDNGYWELFYEFSLQTQDGFTGDFGDIYQHRLRASRDFDFAHAWRLSLYADGVLWDEHGAVSLGFFLQKSF